MGIRLKLLKTCLFIVTPILLLFLILLPHILPLSNSQRVRLGFSLGWVYIFLLCGIYWMFNVISIATVSFIPLFTFSVFGVLDAKTIAAIFLSNHNAVVFGSIVLMMAFNTYGIRKRLTLVILKHSSGSIRWIFIYIYLATVWLAMWINSAAAVYLMMKVINDVLDNLRTEVLNGALGEERLASESKRQQRQESQTKFLSADMDLEASTKKDSAEAPMKTDEIVPPIENSKGQQPESREPTIMTTFDSDNEELLNDLGGDLLFAVAAAANIGGILWPHGNPMGFQIMKKPIGRFDQYASWMVFSLPLILINASIALAYLLLIHFNKRSRVKAFFVSEKLRITGFTQSHETLKKLGTIFAEKYAALPRWKFRETVPLQLMLLAMILIYTREPGFITGWNELIVIAAGDSIPYTIVILIFFLIPAWSFKVFQDPPATGAKSKTSAATFGWKHIQSNYPYALFILIGASESIGTHSFKTISLPMSEYLRRSLGGTPTLLKLVMMLLTVSVTTLLPNPGTSVAIKLLWDEMQVNRPQPIPIPLLNMLSVASLCFVIPASSIPTAMVYDYKGKKTLSAWYMCRLGVPLFFCTFIPSMCYALLWMP